MTTTATRYDVVPIKATIDPETGYLHDTPVVTRSGIFEYRRADGSVQREYRPPSAVFAPEHLRSLAGKPIVVGHPGLMNAKTVKAHQIGTVLSPGRQDGDDKMVVDVVLHDPSPVLERGITELSLGYRITLDETPGEINGERYDAVQTAMFCNHLGVVPRGRAGVSRFNLDSADVEDSLTMPDPTLSDVRLDSGLTYKAAPEVAHAITKLQGDLTAAVARADSATATADGHKATIDTLKAAHATELAQVRADAVAQVRGRLDMEAAATKLGVTVAADATDDAVRRAVIQKVRGDSFDLTGKSDAYVAAAYDLAVQDGATRRDNSGQQRQQMTTGTERRPDGQRNDSAGSTTTNGPRSAADARREFVARRLGQTQE